MTSKSGKAPATAPPPENAESGDQYHHFIPRFILRKFAQENKKHVLVYNNWTRKAKLQPLRTILGGVNLYKGPTAGEENTLEKAFAELEKLTGDILKKISDAIACADGDGADSEAKHVYLVDGEVHTLRRFIFFSGCRNKAVGRHSEAEPRGLTTPASDTDAGRHKWLEIMLLLLRESHEDLLKPAHVERLQKASPKLAEVLQGYKRMARMRLHIWRAPTGEEFLLGNRLIGLESYEPDTLTQGPNDAHHHPRKVPHVYLPVSPETLLVLCSETDCRKQSMLAEAPHKPAVPNAINAKGQIGRKGYRPAKTAYPIAYLGLDHLRVINCLTIPSNLVVYRNEASFHKTIDEIVEFRNEYQAFTYIAVPPVNDPIMDGYSPRSFLSLVCLLYSMCCAARSCSSAEIMDEMAQGFFGLMAFFKSSGGQCRHCDKEFLDVCPTDVLLWFEGMLQEANKQADNEVGSLWVWYFQGYSF